MSKYIKVMADYMSTGLWNEEGVNIEVPEGLSPETVKALDDWCLLYEQNDDYEEPGSRKLPLFDMEAFAKRGVEVAKMIQKDLPDYEIWYFDEYMLQTTTTPRAARLYEYRV